MRRVLDRLRDAVPPVPRNPDGIVLPPPPDWALNDPLWGIWQHGADVLRRGEAVVGWIYMANDVLWRPGDDNAPGGVVYSFDRALTDVPERLAPVAHELYRYHVDSADTVPLPLAAWERTLYDQVYSGLERPFHQRLPPSIAGSRIIYHSSVFFFREHLPTGHLTDHAVPLIVDREETGIALIPPVEWWPGVLTSRWSDGS